MNLKFAIMYSETVEARQLELWTCYEVACHQRKQREMRLQSALICIRERVCTTQGHKE